MYNQQKKFNKKKTHHIKHTNKNKNISITTKQQYNNSQSKQQNKIELLPLSLPIVAHQSHKYKQ